MDPGETQGRPVGRERASLGERLNSENTQDESLTQPEEVISEPRQGLSVRKVGAPFFLTGMRAWAGGGWSQMWLWSRRGRQCVVDQELHFEKGGPSVEMVEAGCGERK